MPSLFVLSLIVVAVLILCLFAYIFYIFGRKKGKEKGMLLSEDTWNKEWIVGKQKVAVEFESIWNEQKRDFQTTVNALERQINRRMLESLEQTRTAGAPILHELKKVLDEAQNQRQPPPDGNGSTAQNMQPSDSALNSPIKRVK
ncbi:hypothetical protein [Kouleothrix sp.]|uniref:hypothetical protein n=1 Tax=Kouleothrix sp. TaxID=2779161 RepID=UPI00391E036E